MSFSSVLDLMDLDALYGAARRQHQDFAKLSEQQPQQSAGNMHYDAFQHSALVTVAIRDVNGHTMVEHWCILHSSLRALPGGSSIDPLYKSVFFNPPP
jgi:hypothetical protein